MKTKHKEGYCDHCGHRLVCAHCFSCGETNEYVLKRVIKQYYERSVEMLKNAAENYVECKDLTPPNSPKG